jgi:acetyl esterase
MKVSIYLCLLGVFAPAVSTAAEPQLEPEILVYKTVAGSDLSAHVFRPPADFRGDRPAIVLFHGGGWGIGSPEWVYGDARRLTALGAVTVAAQYRLSSREALVTPIEAMDDACDVMRWTRQNARKLGVDARRVAAFGISAGGHLAASLAFHCKDSAAIPSAQLLISPAVALGQDEYFQGLLGKRASARDYTPDEQMPVTPPPTIIFNGTLDNLTPIDGARRYCERIRERRGACELRAYENTGHLFTRKQPFSMDTFDPDPEVWKDVTARGNSFLAVHGLLPASRGPGPAR